MAPEILEEVQHFAEQLLDRAQLALEVNIQAGRDEVVVELSGQDADLVLTENARLLHALNHLVSQSFYRKAGGQHRFVVDCNGYRAARAAELELLAGKAAEKAASSRRPFHFQPMPANDRRIIHLFLAEQQEVRTESDGRGMHRRVVVIPEGT